ncbi:hypothetical protein [Oceanobacillus kapialis]|uniref:Uncharacterized protein n=1 Tax=Oceanobacillus kapialis TaxID=481353 RepID=A0ABW5PX28_9BACI
MTTEINFIQKQPNNRLTLLILGGVILLCLCCVAIGLFLQKNHVDEVIAQAESDLAELEITLAELQAEDASGSRSVEQLMTEVDRISESAMPTMPLFHAVTERLTNNDELVSYENNSSDSFIVTANYADMNAVADYIAELVDLTYITNVQLTSVAEMGESYEAVLTVQLLEESLKEEHSANDENIE